MPCQHVSVAQLAVLIGHLRGTSLTPDERARHERFLLQCAPQPGAQAEALAFIRAPEQHPANPRPGSVPDPGEMAQIIVAMR